MFWVEARRQGRPRDPAINDAILNAARQLLTEVGYPRLTMEGVAARAGVQKPTLYLRYPTKPALVFAAAFGKTAAIADPETGSLVDDLTIAYQWLIDELTAPEARAALPGLMADMATDPDGAQLVRSLVIAPEYGRVRDRLERAIHHGEIRADADLELAIDALIGTALVRSAILDHPVDRTFTARTVEMILTALRPSAE